MFIRFARNENYWGEPGVPDEVIFEQFSGPETMVQALRNGELDYVRGTGADLFDALATEENVRVSEGYSNGYTYLSFNTRATQEGYGGSTSALEDQAFRDALGYAIDRQALVDGVLNGHGVAGSTHVPPYHVNWHVEPTTPRTFSIETANQKLDAAGYARGADDIRVDKDGKPIELRLTWPSSEDHTADAQFIQGWFEQIGIGVDAFVTDEDTCSRTCPAPSTTRPVRRTSTSTSGAGVAIPIRSRCWDCSRRTTSRPRSTTASTRTLGTTSSSTCSGRRPTSRRARATSTRCSSCSTTPPATTSCTTTASSTRSGPTSSRTGRTSLRRAARPSSGSATRATWPSRMRPRCLRRGRPSWPRRPRERRPDR